jgi:transposase-like protein
LKKPKSLFKWRHLLPETIIGCVRWYYRYSLSYGEVEEKTEERGWSMDYSTGKDK